MRVNLVLLVPLVIGAFPSIGFACEPILPLAQLLGGSTIGGPLFLTGSLLLLGTAVLLKCAVFVFFERRLPWSKAVWFMLLANVYSTVPGILIAAFAGSMSGSVLALPIVFLLGVTVAGRPPLQRCTRPIGRWSLGGMAVLGFVIFFYFSIFAFSIAQDALATNGFANYWMLKFAFVTVAVTVGIAISTVLEEWAVSRLARKVHGDLSFYPSVLRANYITLGVVLIVAALQTLPRRLNSPHFLAPVHRASSANSGST